MPTYVYECDEGHEFEVEQSMRDPKITECQVRVPIHSRPDVEAPCGASCERLIRPTNFVLLGPGWGREGYQK